MGAALTYARRYALFTLVGIAGEDDLDAPDLNREPAAGAGVAAGPAPPDRTASKPAGRPLERGDSGGRGGRRVLNPEATAEAGDRLLREIIKLPSAEARPPD